MPEMLEQNKPFSNNLSQVTESVLAIKQLIKIEPKQKITVDLILCVSNVREDVIKMLKQYENTNALSKVFELSKAKTEAESIYLELKGKDIEEYQKMLTLLLLKNPLKSLNSVLPSKIYSQSDLWKFGISGDLQILLVKISDTNESFIFKIILKAYSIKK